MSDGGAGQSEKPNFWVKLSMAVTGCLAIAEISSKAIASALSSLVPEGVVKSVLFPLLLIVIVGGIAVCGRIAWWAAGPRDVQWKGRTLGVIVMLVCAVSAYFGARYESGRGLEQVVAWREVPAECPDGGTGGNVIVRIPAAAYGAPNGFGLSWCRTNATERPSIIGASVSRGFSTERETNDECTRIHLESVPRVLRFRECASNESQPGTIKKAGVSGGDSFATKYWEELEWFEQWAF